MALFGQDTDTRAARPSPGGTPAQLNMIGEGTVIEGTIRSEGDIRISGRLVGKLFVRGKAIVSQEGVIEGEEPDAQRRRLEREICQSVLHHTYAVRIIDGRPADMPY